MQILANNISQSAVQISATKADNSLKADSAFAEYLDYASTSANNSQNVDNSNIDSSAVPANNSIDSENTTDKKDKTDLLSEIALFFVNNNTGNLNNIKPSEVPTQDIDTISEVSGSNPASALSDLMQKIQSLIKQAEETKTDDEAESVNQKLREFVLENSNAGISTVQYPNTTDINTTQLATNVTTVPAEISNHNLSQSMNAIDIITDSEAGNGIQQANNSTSINKPTNQISNNYENKTDNITTKVDNSENAISQLVFDNSVITQSINAENNSAKATIDNSNNGDINTLIQDNIEIQNNDTSANLSSYTTNAITIDKPETETIAAENVEFKLTPNVSNSIKTGNSTINTDTLNLSEKLLNQEKTSDNKLNSIEQPTVKTVTTDNDLTVDTASVNNAQLQLLKNKANNTNPENLDKQTNSSSDITTDSIEGATTTNINAGTTNNSGGNRTGQENKQDSTQNNIIFEPSANQREDNTIAGKNNVSKFAEYDKTGSLRIDDIPRYVNKIVSGMPENGTHQATINLSPASLGKVSIEISLNGNLANIKFKAEGIDAVKSIESQLSNLKDNLAKNGIKIESVGVEQKSLDLSNSGNKGSNNPEGGNSQQNQERIKKDYLNYLRRDNLDRMTNIELSNSESLPIRGESQSNNNSLERYI